MNAKGPYIHIHACAAPVVTYTLSRWFAATLSVYKRAQTFFHTQALWEISLSSSMLACINCLLPFTAEYYYSLRAFVYLSLILRRSFICTLVHATFFFFFTPPQTGGGFCCSVLSVKLKHLAVLCWRNRAVAMCVGGGTCTEEVQATTTTVPTAGTANGQKLGNSAHLIGHLRGNIALRAKYGIWQLLFGMKNEQGKKSYKMCYIKQITHKEHTYKKRFWRCLFIYSFFLMLE